MCVCVCERERGNQLVNSFSLSSQVSLTVIDSRADTPGHRALPMEADVHNSNNNNNDIKLLLFSEPVKNSYWRAFPLPR